VEHRSGEDFYRQVVHRQGDFSAEVSQRHFLELVDCGVELLVHNLRNSKSETPRQVNLPRQVTLKVEGWAPSRFFVLRSGTEQYVDDYSGC